MKILIVDDRPDHLKPLVKTLQAAGSAVIFARDIGTAWTWLARGDRYDLVMLDIALEREAEEFAEEHRMVREALEVRGQTPMTVSGQPLGLRLWRQRKTLKQRYCYISNHVQLWMANLDGDQSEFGGKVANELTGVVIDKASLWPHNIVSKLQNACDTWDQQRWLA